METELVTLYNVLNFYKHSLLEILNKIDETMLQAVTTHESNTLRDACSKKFTISMEMVSALQHYVKMLHTCETVYGGLSVKLVELENLAEPEREAPSTNPFTLSVVNDNDETSSSSLIKIETTPRQDSTPSTSFAGGQVTSSSLEGLSTVGRIKRERLDSSDAVRSSDEDSLIIRKSPKAKLRSHLKKSKVVPRTHDGPGTSDRRVGGSIPTGPEDTNKPTKGTDVDENVISVIKNEPPEISDKSPKSQATNNPISIGKTILTLESQSQSSVKKSKARKESQSDAHPQVLPEIPKKSEKSPKQEPDQENHVDNYEESMRQETVKKLENKSLRKTVQWAPTLTQINHVPTDVNQKPKGRNIISNIGESNLRVNERCIICHVESPSEFYVRTDQSLFESFENRFNEDMNKQHQYVINKFKSKPEARSNLGNFCFGFMSSRRRWYRIEVLDWMEHEIDKIFVQLIDYGEKMYWNYTHLKPMADLYALFTKMAVKCHLAGIYSPNLDGTKSWPQASIDYFMEISELGPMTPFVTIFVHREGNSYSVDLRTTKDKNADSLGELLVKNYHALEVKISQDHDFKIEEEEEFDNINEAVAGYDAQDESRICPFTDNSGGCFKGTSCTLEHGVLASDGVTTDKVLAINQTTTQLDLPPAGEIINVLITGYVDTCHFYAQILDEPSGGEVFNDKFVRLMDTMQANNVVQTYESFKIYPGIGEIVLVKNDSKWYRGRCVGYTDNECVEIFLVDIGYMVIRKLKELKVMNEQFTYLPFQAVECILDNCQEKKDASRTLSRKFFDSVMKMKTFRGHVMESTSEILRVQLSDADDMDMSHVLKQWGLGEDRDKAFYSVSNCNCE